MPQEKLAVIIPTKDRSEELRRVLKEISAQDTLPSQIIIVDGSAAPDDGLQRDFPELAIDYIRKLPASLTAQRNAGIRALREDVALAAFLDDDLVLEDNCFTNMMRFWESASSDTGGASFNLTNEIYKKPSFMERLFLVNARLPSRILRSGFQSKVACLEVTTPVEWLPGCAMVWRKGVLDEFMFDEHFSGYARYEEVDFSYRVGRRYRMFIVADAKVQHPGRLESVDASFSLGRMEVVNRRYFVSKYPELSKLLCGWALFGIFMNNVLKGIFGMNRRCMNRARGNFAGLVDVMLKN